MKARSFPKTILIILPLAGLISCVQKNSSVETKTKQDTTVMTSTIEYKPDSMGAYASVNGINMYYEIHGFGKPLVLIHGGGSTIYTSFGTVLPLFALRHKVIAVELQAHGHSGDRNAPESFEQDADDVAELLKQLKINKADILGFSNGGSTALQIAIRHPELVNKLVPVSAMSSREGMHGWFWDFMKKGTFADMPQIYKDAYLAINNDQEKLLNMHNKDAQRMRTFKSWDPAIIRSFKAPALIIVGDKDVVRPEHALEMSQQIQNGRLAILPGGHGDFMGEAMSAHRKSKVPALFVAMVDEFLNESPAQ